MSEENNAVNESMTGLSDTEAMLMGDDSGDGLDATEAMLLDGIEDDSGTEDTGETEDPGEDNDGAENDESEADDIGKKSDKFNEKNTEDRKSKSDSSPDGSDSGENDDENKKNDSDNIQVEIEIDGKKEVKKYSPDELKTAVQKGIASDSRFQEAAAIAKNAQQTLERAANAIKTNPRDILTRAGIDVYQFAEDLITEKFQLESMTDEQRALYEQAQQRSKQQTDAIQQQQQAAQKQQAVNNARARIEADIQNILKTEGLEDTKNTRGPIVFYMMQALNAGQNIDAAGALKIARENGLIHQSKKQGIPANINELEGEDLEKALGPDVLKKLGVKKTLSGQNRIKPKTEQKPRKNRDKRQSTRDFFDDLLNSV